MLWLTSLLLLLSLQVISGSLKELQDVRTALLKPAAAGDCNLDCTGITDGLKIENPKNCYQYYVCSGEKPIGPLDCPDGKYFDVTSGDCAEVTDTECQPCDKGSDATCTYECEYNTSGYVADGYDCSTYHDCSNGAVMHCDQETPFFDGEKCQTEEKKCCHCKPYCFKNFAHILIADPTDCTKYYLCTKEHEIPEISGQCSNGNFDIFIHECSSSAPCLTLCTNVVKPDGCIDVFTCQEVGYFPRCVDKCTQEYYHCSAGDIGSVVAADSCPGETVFDPNESSCVKPSQCSMKEFT